MRKHIDAEVAAWEAKLDAVLTRRGEVVSALMKSIRLQREADALYWMRALLDSGVDRGYLAGAASARPPRTPEPRGHGDGSELVRRCPP
jgi:hypothetical protein